MCGILGLWNLDARPIDVRLLIRATAALRHRGPDDEGYLLANMQSGRVLHCGGRDTPASLGLPAVQDLADEAFDLGFGFRRLAILDPSPAGHQPMSSPDGRYHLMLNGEIYNYRELREQLSGRGHTFRSQGDAEVLLAAYQEWGADALPRLVGMFAFAILDMSERLLFLARDPFGIKPLYFTSSTECLAFASEPGALLEMPGVSRVASPRRLFEYLRFGVTDQGDESLFASIRQVAAAHMLTFAPGDSQPRRRAFWRLDRSRRIEMPFDEAASKLRVLFLDNVRLHLRSDVPIGSALSGGIDSTSILAGMRHLAPDADLRAFSYCADDPAVAEERWADTAARSARATIEKVRLSPSDLAADLQALIRTQGEPFGGTSIYAQHRVFRLVCGSGVRVMLDGQGADELLAGYPPYRAARLASLFTSGRWWAAWRLLRGVSADSTRRRLLADALGRTFSPGLDETGRWIAGRALVPRWLRRDWFGARCVRPSPMRPHRAREVLRETLADALTRTSLPMLLRYEDRNSMAHSIESRVPFLTTQLAEFVLALPEEYLIAPDGTTKSVFRRAMRGLVPDEILDRRDKIGFATPEAAWLRELRPWADRLLRSDAAATIPCLRLEVIRADWDAFIRGEMPYDARLWRCLNLIAWVEAFNISFDA